LNERFESCACWTAGWFLACLPARAWAHALTLERELPTTGEYFRLGVGHILGGLDHLLFLAGLVLVGTRVRDLLWAVSAFTLAHSLSLAASVFGLVTPNPAWIEV
jgi:hydrogenase/urease accessory protein HupE